MIPGGDIAMGSIRRLAPTTQYVYFTEKQINGEKKDEFYVLLDRLCQKKVFKRADLNSIDNLLAQVETKEECENVDTWPAKCAARFDMLLYDEHMLNSALDTMTSIIENRRLSDDEAHVAIELSDFLEFTLHDAVHDNLDYFTAEELKHFIINEYQECRSKDEQQFSDVENTRHEVEKKEDEHDNIFWGLTL